MIWERGLGTLKRPEEFLQLPKQLLSRSVIISWLPQVSTPMAQILLPALWGLKRSKGAYLSQALQPKEESPPWINLKWLWRALQIRPNPGFAFWLFIPLALWPFLRTLVIFSPWSKPSCIQGNVIEDFCARLLLLDDLSFEEKRDEVREYEVLATQKTCFSWESRLLKSIIWNHPNLPFQHSYWSWSSLVFRTSIVL